MPELEREMKRGGYFQRHGVRRVRDVGKKSGHRHKRKMEKVFDFKNDEEFLLTYTLLGEKARHCGEGMRGGGRERIVLGLKYSVIHIQRLLFRGILLRESKNMKIENQGWRKTENFLHFRNYVKRHFQKSLVLCQEI